MLELKRLSGLVIIDEIQRRPELFPILRVLADRIAARTKFLILGSASPALIRNSSETLAGRINFHLLSGFNVGEVGINNHEKLWLRGGFPRSYLASSDATSLDWRRAFIMTFLERDVPQLGIRIQASTLHRFWTMLAHYHGQIWNSSEFARSFGVADTTVRNYLDILTNALIVRQLRPWHENIGKRQVKSPKVFLADSGLLHALLNLPEFDDIQSHPKLGASWEGFVIGEIIHHLQAHEDECYFWATHAGSELDLLVVRGRTRIGFEIKRTSSPRISPSMIHAVEDLHLQRLLVIHSGEDRFPLGKKINAVPFTEFFKSPGGIPGRK
jgi:predicted AAA+ superfamily ATPase